MKRRILFALGIISVLSLCSCQSGASKVVVVNKGKGVIEKAIKQQSASTSAEAAAELWREELKAKDGTISIHVNAEVNRPDKDQLPVVSCMPHYFTLNEVKNVINLFYGDAELYDNTLDDEEWLESELTHMKADLEYLRENGEYPVVEWEEGRISEVLDLESEIVWLEERIAQYEDAYEAASKGASVIGEIKMKKSDSGSELISVKDDQTPPMEFYAFNDKDVNEAAMKYNVKGNGFSLGIPLEASEQLEITTSREEAEQLALAAASASGISECRVVATGKTQIDGQSSYIFTLGRLIDGVAGIAVGDYKASLSPGADGKEQREPWRQENIQVMVNDKGVVGFLWEYPPEILETINESVAIKTYDEIKEIARTILPMQFEDDVVIDKKQENVTICEVTLSMMRIAKIGAENEYYYLPVWDFMGYYGETMDTNITEENPSSTKSFLTLNAVDGSVIDRGLGY